MSSGSHTTAQQTRVAKAESASRTRPAPAASARVVAPFTPRVGRPLPPTTRERMEASFELEHSRGRDDAEPAAADESAVVDEPVVVDENSGGADPAAIDAAAAVDEPVVMDEPAAAEQEAGLTDAAALAAANVTAPAPAATLGAAAHRPAADDGQLDERQTVRRESAAGDARWTTRSRILGRARAVASAGDAAGAAAPAQVARAAPELAAEVAPRPEAAEAVTMTAPASRPGEGAAAPVEPEVKPDTELKLGLELEQGAAPAVAPGGTRRRGGVRLTVAGGSGGPGGDPDASGAWREPSRALIRVDAAPPTTDDTGAPPRRVEAHARGPPASEETRPKTTRAAGDDTALDDLRADPEFCADDLHADPADVLRNDADVRAGDVRADPADDLRAQPAIRAAKPLAPLPRAPVIQAKLAVSTPGDSFELEADAVATRVLHGASPRPPTAGVLVGRLARAPPRQHGPPRDGFPDSVSAVLQIGGGRSLDAALRARIEPHVGLDLSHVRVRQDPAAAAAAHDLRARAFTSGSTIFLAAESSPTDVALMAHEATHVAQQHTVAAARTTLMRDVTDYLPDVSVGDIIPDWILDGVRSAVRAIPGYTLLTYITGTDPLTDEPVTVSREELIETLLTYGPFGAAVGTVLQSIDVLGEIFGFVSEGLVAHDLTLARLRRDIGHAWDELSVTNGIAGNVAIVERYVNALLRDVGSFVASIVERVLEIVRSVVAEVAEPLLETPEIAPVWNLAKKVLHHDPLRGVEVQAETAEIIADFLRLIGQEQRLAQMEERGTLQETADWLDTQLGTFASLVTELGTLFSDAWAAIQPQNLPDLFTNLGALAQRAFGFVQRVGEFAATVIVKILELIKDALLGWLSEHAHTVPGFHLLTVILGQNPFTGDQVLRTAENLIKGFITLMPGGEATYDQLAESGVIGSAAERIEGEMARLGISLELITGIFLGIWDTLTLDDLLDPIGAFGRILDLFGEPLSRLIEFIGVVIEVVITLVLRLMNFPSDLLGSIIANALQAIEDIKRDPVAFVKNMLRAVVLGFSGFFDNILTYLTQGLTAWLFRGLGQLGITIPSDFSLQSILTLVVQVLGITVDTLWTKLGKHIGEERVAMIRGAIDQLSGAWAFIKDVQEGGIAAVWRYVTDQLSGLWDTLLTMAKDWIMTTIIGRVTAKLLTLLDPTGVMAVVNSFIAFFAAVQSAIEYLRDILEIINRYVMTFAQVAAGNIVPGAQMLEQGLASAIPVAIGFLANQVGLGNIPEKIVEIIGRLRQLVDQALDWLIAQAVRLGQAALNALTGERPGEQDADIDPNDHEAVAARVQRELETAPRTPEDYPALRTEKETQARALEQRYAGRLGAGIALIITFDPATADLADNDLDFEIVIAPNTKRKKGAVPVRPTSSLVSGVLVINVDGRVKQFHVADEIQVKHGGAWYEKTRVIKAFSQQTMGSVTLIFLDVDTEPPGAPLKFTANTYPTGWREPIAALRGLSPADLAVENAVPTNRPWRSEQVAIWVLNHRAHGKQTINPSRKQWEHIVEEKTGGPNSADNLALADEDLNHRLGVYYGEYRRYHELALEDIMDPIILRDYLRGKSTGVQRRWKLKVYASADFGVALRWEDLGNGRFQVLE